MMAPRAAPLIAPMGSSLIQPITSLLISCITGKGQEDEFLQLLALPLMMKVLAEGIRRAGRGYMNKHFYLGSIF